MADSLNVLLLEDRDSDADLILRVLREEGFEAHCRRATTEREYTEALSASLDVVVADYSLPGFDAPEALRILKERGLDVPFIVISGTIGDELSVGMLKAGADDYVLKDRPGRLGTAIRQAIAKRQLDAQKRDAEERYRTLVEFSPDAIVIHEQGRVAYLNPAAVRFFGASDPAELLGKHVIDFVHPESKETVAARFKEMSQGRPQVLIAERLLRLDGAVLDTEVVATPIRHQGRPAILAVIRDVTDRTQAENQYRRLFEGVPIGLHRVLPSGKILDVNPALVAMLGYPDSESLRRTDIAELWVDPGERKEFVEAVAARGIGRSDTRFRKRDGSIIWVALHSHVVRSHSGEVLHHEGAVIDVTERKRAELALTERARLAQFAAEIGAALTEVGDVTEMLRRCTEIMVDRLDAAFARIWTLNAAEDVLELQASAGLYTHTDGAHGQVPVGRFEIGLIAAERRPHLSNSVIGDPRVSNPQWARREGMVSFAGYPLLVEDRLLGVMAMFARHPLAETTFEGLGAVANSIALAIDNRRRATALRQALTRAEASDRLKSAFLANISHEIRTPLNIIVGFCDILQSEMSDAQQEPLRSMFEGIKSGASRLVETVHGILDMARLQSDTFEFHPKPLDLGRLIQEAVGEFEPAAREKGLTLIAEIGEPEAIVIFDEYCLSRSLHHLLDNAVKFTVTGGVTVRLSRASKSLLALEVRDTGIGIDEEYLVRLFRPFSQEDFGYSRHFEGSGLGLALARRFLELGGARISVESTKDVGTAFLVHLPQDRSAAQSVLSAT